MSANINTARRLRLIAFQFAGSNRHAYRLIQRRLAQHVELCCFELPGRGRRHAEALLTELPAMVANVIDPIAECVRGFRYALFGHSMGALLAHLAGRRLLERGLPPPLRLIVSGSAAPSQPLLTERHRLSPGDFLRELRTLGGCPDEVLNDAELVDLFLPVLRADFQALETYRAEPGAPLPYPITMLRGTEDGEVARAGAEAWRAETSGEFDAHDLPGGHFFIFENLDRVVSLIERVALEPDRAT